MTSVSLKRFCFSYVMIIFTFATISHAQINIPNPIEAVKEGAGHVVEEAKKVIPVPPSVVVNPIVTLVQAGAQAAGADKGVTAATQAVIAPASLLDPAVRNNLPGEASVIANKAAGAAEAATIAAFKTAVAPYDAQSELGRKA